MKRYIISFVSFLFLNLSLAVNATNNFGVKPLEQAFATSSVMSDSDALTFGIANFELKNISDEDLDSEKTLNLKKSIDILVLPYTWQLQDIEDSWSHNISARIFYIEVNRNTELLEGFTNFKAEQVFGAFVEYSQQFELSKNMYTGIRLGGHIMHYRNKYNYSDGFPTDLIDILDGHIFNTNATVVMAEPVLDFGYTKQQFWGQWTLHNSNHYLIGQGIAGAAKNISDVKPESWRVSNGIEFKVNVPNLWGVSDHIAFDITRTDIGGDISNLSNEGHYYEASVGWVIDTKKAIPLIDNVGIGFSINYGSSISGGTIVLYYNE